MSGAAACKALTFLALVTVATLAAAQAGQLDSSFGNNGIFASNFGSSSLVFGTSIALQSDGKIVVGGEAGNPGIVVRLNGNGTVDTGFGTSGVVSIRFRDVQNITVGVAIQASQRIVVVGTGLPGGGQLIRLNTDGSVDTSFGNGGSVALGVTPQTLALQPDDKVVVAGRGGGSLIATMTRYTADGQVDSTFGSGGTAPLVAGAAAIAFQADGKILAASGSSGFSAATSGSIVRYNTDGSLDTIFGINGQVSDLAGPAAVALQSNGQIVTAGSVTSSVSLSASVTGFGLTEFFPTGFPTFLFGTHGGAITPFPNFGSAAASSMVIQSNGFIVAAGNASSSPQNSVFALARYVPTGQLDTSFGMGGRVTTSFGNNTAATISAIVLQSDGKIVAVGTAGGNIAVARYLGH
jgi:uncharacterized delta-60 repeat protein